MPEYGLGRYLKDTNTWNGEVSVGKDVKVIAWQPLPKPYKEAKILVKPNPRDIHDNLSYCSNCGETLPIYNYDKLHYCPNCGIKWGRE